MRFCRECGTPTARVPVPSRPPAGVLSPMAQAVAASQPAKPSCTGCGAGLDPGGRFCKFCGTPAAAATGAPPPHVAAELRPVRSASLEARVVVILRDGSEGGVYPIDTHYSDIGSREGSIILRDDPYLSHRHARIERRGDTFVLVDLRSVNGIYLRLREPTQLADGDMVLVGQQVLRFDLLSEAERQVGPAMQHGVMVFGTPEAPRVARLVQYTTEGLERDVYYLYRDETAIGREQADLVFPDDPFLSRRHAAISMSRDYKRFLLRDLGSSNGSALRARGEVVLQSGDQFRLGRHLFRFDLLSSGGRH